MVERMLTSLKIQIMSRDIRDFLVRNRELSAALQGASAPKRARIAGSTSTDVIQTITIDDAEEKASASPPAARIHCVRCFFLFAFSPFHLAACSLNSCERGVSGGNKSIHNPSEYSVPLFFYLIFFEEAITRWLLFWRKFFLAPTRSSARTRHIAATSPAACASRISDRSRARSILRAQLASPSASICRRVCAAQRFVNCKPLFYAAMLIVGETRQTPNSVDAKNDGEAPKRKRDTRELARYQAQQPSFSDDYRLVAFALLPYQAFSACSLLSDVIRGDRGQYAFLGDTWKYEGANVCYVMRRKTAVHNIQAWRCVRINKTKHCSARAHSGELRLSMYVEHRLKY